MLQKEYERVNTQIPKDWTFHFSKDIFSTYTEQSKKLHDLYSHLVQNDTQINPSEFWHTALWDTIAFYKVLNSIAPGKNALDVVLSVFPVLSGIMSYEFPESIT